MDEKVDRCPYCGGRIFVEFIGNYGDAYFIRKGGGLSKRPTRRFIYGKDGEPPKIYCPKCHAQFSEKDVDLGQI